MNEIDRLKAENASLRKNLDDYAGCVARMEEKLAAAEKERDETRRSADGIAGELANWRAMADRNEIGIELLGDRADKAESALAAAEQRAEAAEKRSTDLDRLAATMAERTFEGRCACGERVFVGNGTIESHKDRNANPCIGGRAALRERDAEHEVALKKARADALEEAAALAENDASYQERGDPRESALRTLAGRLRALLEEAGRNG